MKNLTFFAFLLISTLASAQTSQTYTDKVFDDLQDRKSPTDGKIIISQNDGIQNLINKYINICSNENKMDGWRIQIYNSSGKEAREEANNERDKFVNKYPDIKAYLVYQAPYFKIRIGNYRTKQDAFEVYKTIVKDYPISYLVPDKINFPEL